MGMQQKNSGSKNTTGNGQQQASSNLLPESQTKSLPARMIVNQQVSTVQSTMGLYGFSNPTTAQL